MASASGPSKGDIEAVFNRLRAQATNKVIDSILIFYIGLFPMKMCIACE